MYRVLLENVGLSCTVRERGCIVYSYRTWVYRVLLENVGVSCTVRERGFIVYC